MMDDDGLKGLWLEWTALFLWPQSSDDAIQWFMRYRYCDFSISKKRARLSFDALCPSKAVNVSRASEFTFTCIDAKAQVLANRSDYGKEKKKH
jgi:hypothetical protein